MPDADDPVPTARPSPAPTLPREAGVPALRPVPVPDSAPRPSTGRRWAWALAALVALGGGGFAYLQWGTAGPPVVAVEIAKVAPATRVLAVNGRIAATRSVEVRSAVNGTLTTLGVAEGDRVEPGQILGQVDATAQAALVRQAVASLDAALVARQGAVEAYDRAVALGGAVARTTLDAATRARDSALQDVARQTAILDQARAVVDSYTIRAPIAGTVLALDAEAGQIVGPATPLMTLADLTDLVVETDIDEAYARQVALDQPAVLLLAGETDPRAGHVSFLSAKVNVATGGLAIRIAFDTPLTAPVGLTVATNIIVDQRAAALTVPRTALVTGPEGQSVFIVTDATAHLHRISVVDWPADRLIVTDGLTAGDVVVTDQSGITDGQSVTADPVPADQP